MGLGRVGVGWHCCCCIGFDDDFALHCSIKTYYPEPLCACLGWGDRASGTKKWQQRGVKASLNPTPDPQRPKGTKPSPAFSHLQHCSSHGECLPWPVPQDKQPYGGTGGSVQDSEIWPHAESSTNPCSPSLPPWVFSRVLECFTSPSHPIMSPCISLQPQKCLLQATGSACLKGGMRMLWDTWQGPHRHSGRSHPLIFPYPVVKESEPCSGWEKPPI